MQSNGTRSNKGHLHLSYKAYILVAFMVDIALDILLIWSVGPKYSSRFVGSSNPIGKILSAIPFDPRAVLLNFIVLILLYALLVALINRFWIATSILIVIVAIFAIATKIKFALRGEPIQPIDLSVAFGGGGDNILSFVPPSMMVLIIVAIVLLIAVLVLGFILQHWDVRKSFVNSSWKHPFAVKKDNVGIGLRLLAAALCVGLLGTYAIGLGIQGSPVYKLATALGYDARKWDLPTDAKRNGALTTFLSSIYVNKMDEPNNYSERTMKNIRDKYFDVAESLNRDRIAELTDSTVIMVLSESFADPQRVPGISFTSDPLEHLHALNKTTTSGLMLSSGYGGGTANMEFQALTGLNTTDYNADVTYPYQQIVPSRDSFFAFNQMWNQACGSDACSVAFHPYRKSFYSRDSNYKKFGFSSFRTLDSENPLPDANHLGKSPYVSDKEAYGAVVQEVKEIPAKENQFVSLITMQNHLPYKNWYSNNQFVGSGDTSSRISSAEKNEIETYTKGASTTDEETNQFLKELNSVDKPITVIFYGDHLPGIYSTASKNAANDITLHETDYFIWSNKASASHTTKLSESNAAYTSPNFFMAQAAEHMNAKVSPYLAFLTQMHAAVPAMARISTSASTTDTTLLDDKGKVIPESRLSKEAKDLLNDYKLIQYDMSVGKNYLKDMKFTSLPH